MTKRIEEIKEGDKFTKGDWTLKVRKIYSTNPSSMCVSFVDACGSGFWLTESQTEAINTWIEDTSISQAAADVLKKAMSEFGVKGYEEFIQSLVKK